jgi:hypothetical protein
MMTPIFCGPQFVLVRRGKMTKVVTMNAVLIICLCTALLTLAQDKDAHRVNRERANQIAAKVEQAIRVKEPKWKLKQVLEAEVSVQQYWKSGKQEVRLSIFINDSLEEASKLLASRSNMSSVAAPNKLEGVGDEAYYMTHPYFSVVGVRRGRAVVEVFCSGPALTVTRRFAQYALEQIEDR